MHISNFRAVKRIPDLMEMFARIQRALPARLILVGDGPERQRAAEIAAELGMAERVVFLGKIDSVAELLAGADLFLLPSEQESFGLVALEAQASAVPVVGSSGTGLDEVVEHGVTGYLHPVGAVDAMATSAISLLSDEARWDAFSSAARDRALARFTIDRIVPCYESLYRDVLADGDGSRVATE